MLELIQEDPARALALSAPFPWRQKLPQTVARYLEEQVDGRGNLEVALDGGAARHGTAYRQVTIHERHYAAFVYGWRLTETSKKDVPLHGIALDGKLALSADPMRLLDGAEAAALDHTGAKQPRLCPVCSRPATGTGAVVAETGGDLGYYCGLQHQRVVSGCWIKEESKATPKDFTPGQPGPTLGRKTVLYMRVNFPDDLTEPIPPDQACVTMNEVNDFFVANSYDLTSLTATVTPLLTLPRVKNDYSEAGPFELLNDARAAARLAGYDTAFYDLDIVCHTAVPKFDWAGLGVLGGRGVWLQVPSAGVAAHELGHNYGLVHANFWDTTTNGLSSISVGWNREYGNSYDTMGAAAAGANHFNACFKNQLKWLPASAVANVTTSGVYRVYSFDVGTRTIGPTYAARVARDFQRDYWLEARQQFSGNFAVSNGLLLNWSPWLLSDGGTDLIDTTPLSVVPDARSDAALALGRTFSDVPAGVHITPLTRGIDGTNTWFDVEINLGAFPENQPPWLKLQIDNVHPQSGQFVHFYADTFDPDGDALAWAWWVDNVELCTNNLPWLQQQWFGPGAHTIRCVASDMKGGTASENAVVYVGSVPGISITGRLFDTNGVPVEGARVDNLADANACQTLVAYTDSDGRFVLPGVRCQANLAATKFGFVFTNSGWANPIASATNVLAADFTATPLPVVTMTASTNEVPENGSASAAFLLSRMGDLSTNLLVQVLVGGSATMGDDYQLQPPLTNGVNLLEFPPGTSTLQVLMRPISDTIVEGTENVILELFDNEAYAIGSPGQATISIRDDGLSPQPSIAITASSSLIPENGTDAGEVLFTRTGGTQGDLYLYYELSGTATAGVDYRRPPGVVLIPAGQTSAAVRLLPIDDKLVEPDETIIVTLLPDSAYNFTDSSAELTILDDDVLTVSISATGANAQEPNIPGRFTVKRDGDLTSNLQVKYSATGSAAPGQDYLPLTGEVLIPAGAPSADIVLTPVDDQEIEGDESVTLTLSNSKAYNIASPGSATLFIIDDEKPTVTVRTTDGTASEPGENFGAFVISRGPVTGGNLTVYLAIGGTAGNGIDYVPLDHTIVIPNGQTQVTLDVIPFDDLHAEPTETVQLFLLPSTNYNVGQPRNATVNIEDDDYGWPAVGFTFASSQGPESESGRIAVSLSSPSPYDITVNYRVIGGTATSNDYVLPPGMLTIPANKTTAVLPLQIRDNSTAQPDRTIKIALYDPLFATLDGIKIHTYTILDDDLGTVTLEATAPDAFENGQSPGNFRITRAGPTGSDLPVYFQVAGTATAPADFVPLGTSIVIPAGAAYVDLPVVPVADQIEELDETVTLELLRAPGARLLPPNSATVIIHDSSVAALPLVAVTSTNRHDAPEGGPPGEFVFYRDQTNGELTVSFTLTGTATPGSDYEALPGSVTFPSGSTSVSLQVSALDDLTIEGEETVILALTRQENYRVTYPGSAWILVQDRDQKVRVDASDFYAAEPGLNLGEFTFTRIGTTNGDLLVRFAISGDAVNGVDYATITNTIIIPAGSATARLPIQPLDDPLVEGPEMVTLTLDSDPYYVIDEPHQATLILDDDEPMLTLTATASTVVEGSQVPGVLTLTRTGNPRYEFTAYLSIAGTATPGVDYPALPDNVFFPCGVTEIDLPVYPWNELVVEGAEKVFASLVPNPAYTVLGTGDATVTIQDAGLNHAPEITVARPARPTVNLHGPNVMLLVQAAVTDDGDVEKLTNTWTMISGPAPVSFGTSNSPETTVTFTNAGFYVLRLTADDGQLQSFYDLNVNVTGPQLFSDALLHWPLDETDGTTAADVSGNGRDGVLVGNPLWVSTGVIGGALQFTRPTDYLRSIETSNLFNGRKEFSVSIWVNPAVTNADQTVFCANPSATNGTLGLYMRRFATCGNGTNVYEITLRTTRGEARYVSASGAVKPGWHNVLFAWSSGSGLELFVDGVRDRPGTRSTPLGGAMANSPEFIIGKGPPLAPFPLQAQVDDVLIFPRALLDNEAAGIGAGGGCTGTGGACQPVNFGPDVDAGTNMAVQLPIPVLLAGVVSDDGLPDPPAMLSNAWVLVSGPAPVSIPDPNALTNSVQFSSTGEYVFRLIADDGEVATCDEVTITVIEPTRVDIWASDYEGAELGPDPAEFTLMRTGDLNYDLTVFLDFSGIATNGVDFVSIPDTVTFTNGAVLVALPVWPYLDHRTEGDQDLAITIRTNLGYSIGSGQASIIIHDSPYGNWTIAHFTLEELTDPGLSGETADFDHDGLINFVEYASNEDPKSPATSAPLQTRIETDANDKLPHVVLTFHRRLQPTDLSYTPSVSNDLLTWNSGPNYLEEVQATDDGNGVSETVKVRVRAPVSPDTNLFVTVRLKLNTTQP